MILLDRAIRYAERVVAGKEITTKEVIIQCKWFLIDLKKQNNDDFKFYFDEDKLKIIDAYQQKNELACMVGDGINDAQALTT